MVTVGFIGTGNIGNPMARHVLEGGHDLVVYDRNPGAPANLYERGARPADHPRDVAEAARLVFLSLPGPREVEDVLRGRDGLLGAARQGDVIVDLTTNSVSAVRRMAAVAAEAGVLYLDAPVTGGVRGAEAGTLTMLVSGDRLGFERAEPVMRTIAATLFYLGETGTGTLVKLINNLVLLCSGQLVEEGLVLAAKAGLDPVVLFEALSAGTSRPYLGMFPAMVGRRFENPSFTLELAAKDVGLALETARDLSVAMPVTSAAHQTYLRGVAGGLGPQSFLATLEVLEAGAGTRVPQVAVEPPAGA